MTQPIDLWPSKPAESISINQLKELGSTFKNLCDTMNACTGAARSDYQGRLGNLFHKWGGVLIQAALNDLQVRPFGLIEARKQAAEQKISEQAGQIVRLESDYNLATEEIKILKGDLAQAELKASQRGKAWIELSSQNEQLKQQVATLRDAIAKKLSQNDNAGFCLLEAYAATQPTKEPTTDEQP